MGEKKTEKEEKEEIQKRKGKHKAEATIGDIVFRVLIMVVIFFIVVITYVFYLQGMKNREATVVYTPQEVTKNIQKIN